MKAAAAASVQRRRLARFKGRRYGGTAALELASIKPAYRGENEERRQTLA